MTGGRKKPQPSKTVQWVPSSADEAPWERQPGEGDKPFSAWILYRDLGRRRSTHAVAVQLGLSDAAIHEHARRWSWVIRAAQFDAYLDRERVQARVDEIRKMEERHAQIAAGALATMMMPIAALSRHYRPAGPDGRPLPVAPIPRAEDLDTLDTKQLLKLAAEAGRVIAGLVGVERLSRGEATEIVRAPYTPAGGETDAQGAVPLDSEKAELIARAMEEAGLVAEGAFQLGPAAERDLRIAVDAVELGEVVELDDEPLEPPDDELESEA